VRRGGGEEGSVAVGQAAPAGADAAESAQVGVGTLDRPAARHEAAVLGAARLARVARDVGREAVRGDAGAEGGVVEGAVGREHARARVGRHAQDGQRLARGRQVVAVAASYGEGEDEPAPVDDGRPLRALLAPVEARRPPFCVRDSGAFTWHPSTARNVQSIAPAACAASKLARCSRSNTPARLHSRKRRSAVADEHSPVAFSARQGQPARMTNQIASIARRAGTGGRPPRGRNGCAGSNGSSTAHNRSGKRHASIVQVLLRLLPMNTSEVLMVGSETAADPKSSSVGCRVPVARRRSGLRQGLEHLIGAGVAEIAWTPIKALLLHVTAVVGFRVASRRTLAEMSPGDFVAAVALEAIVRCVPNAPDTSYLAGATTLVTVLRVRPPRSGRQS
jgi:hypothetical protein